MTTPKGAPYLHAGAREMAIVLLPLGAAKLAINCMLHCTVMQVVIKVLWHCVVTLVLMSRLSIIFVYCKQCNLRCSLDGRITGNIWKI